MHQRWGHLLYENFEFFLPRFPAYAKAIEDATIEKAGQLLDSSFSTTPTGAN
jgi:hypothetical protein